MSRAQQDSFIDDDEEECCPLCVEEFDLTDKGFRPCPCGYQICQFCYNNVKTNMNGLCPACRRVYDDNNIEYKVITPEEMAAHKTRQAQKQKKTQAALQKEKQKAEADNLSRKHLQGLRVVQKNLVYVTGLQPTTHEDQLLQTLRGQDYFGQYGRIIKIVVSKAKDPSHPHSVGVYVTFESKEDAEKCIAAVNGSKNQDRTLRAQFGTTKYCSAYLRGENCTNRNCMFLHEPGEANESYSRADLSALNATSAQHNASRAAPQPQQPIASASQPMARQSSSDQPQSPDRPALPSTASWASKLPQVQPARTESRSTSGTVESPVVEEAIPASVPSEPAVEEPITATTTQESDPLETPARQAPRRQQRRPRELNPLLALLKKFDPDNLKLTFSLEAIPQSEREVISTYPPLFDPNGGAKRKLRRQREEEQRRMEREAQAFQQPPPLEPDDNPEASGSLQLGGEPEERRSLSQPQSAIQPPGVEGVLDQRFQFGGGIASPGVGERGLTPQQHQQMLLQTMKASGSSQQQQGSYLNNFNNQPNSSFSQQPHHPPGHQRNASRYSFANDTASTASAVSVKPVANPKLLTQQSAMMPGSAANNNGQNHFGGGGAQHSNFYTSNVQGPPPGIKMSGTPPVSGGMTFGQGHGFATGGLAFGAENGRLMRNPNEEMMRNLLRGREGGAAGAAPGMDTGAKRTTPTAAADDTATNVNDDFPPLAPPTTSTTTSTRPNLHSTNSSVDATIAQESATRRPTPPFPPGLPKNIANVAANAEVSPSPSRAGLKRLPSSTIVPALPLRPVTPAGRSASRAREAKVEVDEEVETPTKPPRGAGRGSLEVEEAVTTPEKAVEKELPLPNEEAKKKPLDHMKPNLSGPFYIQPASKGQATVETSDAQAVPETPTKPEAGPAEGKKRTPPGKLDITAAVKQQPAMSSSAPTSTDSGTPSVAQRSVARTPAETSSPSGSITSPAAKPAPKTIRVVPSTTKAEPTPASSRDRTTSAAAKQPSRQPSVASIQIPGTPSSEQVSISDNVSIPSTSQSRANSPPPAAGGSKVGSVRGKTKTQLKKERQERAKAIEVEKKAEDAKKPAAVVVEEEQPAQEAIISRKKKTKKEKEHKAVKAKAPAPPTATEESTPTASRAPSPPKAVEELVTKIEPVIGAEKAKSPEPSTPTRITPSKPPPQEPSPPPTPTLSAAQILAELKATAPELQKCIDSLFRSATTTHYKPSQPISPADLDNPAIWDAAFKVNLTKPDVDALLKGKVPAVRYNSKGDDGGKSRVWERGMVTPSGAHLRALTEELETRFLELEKAIRELPAELSFRPSKPQNEVKFPSIDLQGLKRQFESPSGRGVSLMERAVQEGSDMTKGSFLVDEARGYVNEFVMPPATPPPTPGSGGASGVRGQQQQQAAQGATSEMMIPSLEIAERQLNDARRMADERDQALKKVMKKNKKLLGLG